MERYNGLLYNVLKTEDVRSPLVNAEHLNVLMSRSRLTKCIDQLVLFCIIMQLLTQYDLFCILIGSLHIYYPFIVSAFTKYGAVRRAPRNLKVLAANLEVYAQQNELHCIFNLCCLTTNGLPSLFITWLPKLLSLCLIASLLNFQKSVCITQTCTHFQTGKAKIL